jgi:hypothetical protein
MFVKIFQLMKSYLFFALLSIPILMSLSSTAQHISAGGRHTLVICEDSTAQSWGYNGYGQLGNGNITEQYSGVKVIGLSEVVFVAGGLFHSIFIKKDGTAWTCGRNKLGPLGDGTSTDRHIPVQVSKLSDVIQASGGGEHSLFLKRDHTVWACGANAAGQLGDGSTLNKMEPVAVIGLTDVIQVAAGAEFSLFLKMDGSVWACGHNGFGQFGNGTNGSSKIPVQIIGLTDIISITAGEWHSLFVKKDGTVYSSGRNQYGQLGNGTQTDNWLASPIPDLDNIVQAEAGGIHSVFVNADGYVFACGLNSGGNNDGQLGDGTSIDRNKPVPVISSWGQLKIIHAEACREHSLFLTDNGQIWASGRNNYGQLGSGTSTTTNFSTPIHSNSICSSISVSFDQLKEYLNSMLLYPNPMISSGTLKLDFKVDEATIYIYNSYGTLCKQLNLNNENEIKLNLADLQPGIYILVLKENHDIIYRYKIVLNR